GTGAPQRLLPAARRGDSPQPVLNRYPTRQVKAGTEQPLRSLSYLPARVSKAETLEEVIDHRMVDHFLQRLGLGDARGEVGQAAEGLLRPRLDLPGGVAVEDGLRGVAAPGRRQKPLRCAGP